MAARILVVDDEWHICALVAECLRDDGHDVACFTDPLAAFESAVRDPPDLVVTDLMMPGLDGAGLIRALREVGIAAPVLVITAVPERAAGIAAVAVVAKPFDLGELCDEVARVLDG